MKRIIALLLAVVLTLAVCAFAVSCGEDTPAETSTSTEKKETTSSSSASTSSTSATSSSATSSSSTPDDPDVPDYESWNGRTKMPGMMDIDFGGKTFLIAARTDESTGGWNNPGEIWVESLNNEAVNDAVYERNRVMKELYNCSIEVDDGGWANGFNADISSGGGKYIAGCAAYQTGASGSFYNVLNLDIDFTQPWWDTAEIRDLSCNGKLYEISGDFAVHVMRAAWIMFYNKDIYEQNLASEYNIYQLVRDKKWTVDTLLTMCQKVLKDNNGDQEYTYSDAAGADMIGMVTTAHNYRALWFACGERYVDKDDNGKMVSAISRSGRGSDVIDKVRTLTADASYLELPYTSVHQAMMNGTALFAGEVLGTLEVMAQQEDLRLGIVPQPLYDENQTEYYHYVNNQAAFYLIPTSYADMETIADFFTLFAAHSQKLVRTAFINTYKYNYASDEESGEMLDLILNSRVYDPGYLFSFSEFDGIMQNLMEKTGANNFASAANRYESKTNANIATYEERIKAINDPV